jgi:hypothetical protein
MDWEVRLIVVVKALLRNMARMAKYMNAARLRVHAGASTTRTGLQSISRAVCTIVLFPCNGCPEQAFIG